MCPSGSTLVAGACHPINSCTDKPDNTVFPHQQASQYILCLKGKEIIKKCPDKHIFHHNRCELMTNLNHYCKIFTTNSFLLDDVTRVDCMQGKAVFFTCKPGTKFFNNKDLCEPALCDGLPDGSQIRLPDETIGPFHFSPGYITCQGSKIHETVKCAQHWDKLLSNGDNLTFLPMVYDGTKCSTPTFCENVFADDPDIVVPVHEFSKHVKNWDLSELYDHAVGYSCENKTTRKRKYIPVDSRISKRFKIEPACGPSMPTHLPVFGDPKRYYNCNSKSLISCPRSQFFNGSSCVGEYKDTFKFNGLPMFSFSSLNKESWIEILEYSNEPATKCQDPETHYNSLYNICSHPDCATFAFASQIPEMAFLLPREHQAKCKFYENKRVLKKEPVDFKYLFWTQRTIEEGVDEEKDDCVPGQKLKSGNFIWDTTVYATCKMNQPFVFCPSTHTKRIIPVDQYYVCEPPQSDHFILATAGWNPFATNEIKRILPIESDNNTLVRLRRGAQYKHIPNDGLDIALDERLNLYMNKPVKLELRHRITNPPNVAFDYSDPQNTVYKTSHLNHGYVCRKDNFSSKTLTFPKYLTKNKLHGFNNLLYS